MVDSAEEGYIGPKNGLWMEVEEWIEGRVTGPGGLGKNWTFSVVGSAFFQYLLLSFENRTRSVIQSPTTAFHNKYT